jgi:O-antigen/teichoic acid export membrane protein
MSIASFKNLFFGGSTLSRRAAAAGRVLFAKSAALGVMEVIRTTVLARLVAPADYGLMALAMLVITLLESFSTTGIDILIQRDRGRLRDRLNAYWTIKAARGVILAILACGLALPLEWYYGLPGLRLVVWALALGFLFRGFSGFGAELCQRHLRFGQLARAEILAAATALALGLAAAIWLRNVWALVLISLLSAAGTCAVSHLLFPWRPALRWNPALLKTVSLFGGSVVALNLCNYFFTSFDRGALGKLLGLESVGFYARAHFLALLPVLYFANILAPIFLPTFRRMAQDPLRLRRAFLKAFGIMIAAAGVFAIVFFLLARPIILTVYGERWLPVLPLVRILVIFGAAKAVSALFPSIFFLKNKPWMAIIPAALMAVGLATFGLPLTHAYGAAGMAWAVTFSGLAANALALILVLVLLRHPPRTSPKTNA